MLSRRHLDERYGQKCITVFPIVLDVGLGFSWFLVFLFVSSFESLAGRV